MSGTWQSTASDQHTQNVSAHRNRDAEGHRCGRAAAGEFSMDRSLGERLPGRGVRELEDRPFFNPLGDTGQVQQPVLAVHHPTTAVGTRV